MVACVHGPQSDMGIIIIRLEGGGAVGKAKSKTGPCICASFSRFKAKLIPESTGSLPRSAPSL